MVSIAVVVDCSANNQVASVKSVRILTFFPWKILYTLGRNLPLFFMTTKKTFAALSLMFLLTACQASVESESDAMVEGGESSSAAMEQSEASEETMADGQSSLTFVGGSTIIDHDGGFSDFTVDVGNSADIMNSTVTATVVMDSVYSDSEGLTGHLKREDFFDVETYPTATFTSTEIIGRGEGFDIVGDLTLKGVTKSIIMNASLREGVLHASFDLPRKEFGVGNDSYGDKILDESIPVKAVVYLQ